MGGTGVDVGRYGMGEWEWTNVMARRHNCRWASTVDERGDVDGVSLVKDSPQVGDERYVMKKCLIQ